MDRLIVLPCLLLFLQATCASRPCPAECTCGVLAPLVDPVPPFPLIDCKLSMQGLEADLLFPDTRRADQDRLVIFDTVPDEMNVHLDTEAVIVGSFGDNAYPFVSLYSRIFHSGSVVLDIGANAGLYSVILSLAYPDIRVISLEPLPWLASLARENLRRNGISENRSQILTAALTHDGRNVTLHEQTIELEASNIYASNASVHSYVKDPWTVPSYTIAQLMDLSGEVAFVKVDCEGCEFEIVDDVDEIAALGIPYILAVHGYDIIPMGPYHDLSVDARCRKLAEKGALMFLQTVAKRGCPVALAMLAFQAAWVKPNRTEYVQFLRLAVDAGSATQAAELIPTFVVRSQYMALVAIFQKLAFFYLAAEYETGEEMLIDWHTAAALFDMAAELPLQNSSSEAIRVSDWKPLAWITAGAMFRLGELLSKGGAGLDQDTVGAEMWWQKAAARGHAMAQSRLASARSQPLVGTNGIYKGNLARQFLASVQLESLGVSRSMQHLVLGVTAATAFDECMANDQGAQVSRWEDVFESKNKVFDHLGTYRFRSWFHSAMKCWLSDIS